jgi:hypothetical protein
LGISVRSEVEDVTAIGTASSNAAKTFTNVRGGFSIFFNPIERKKNQQEEKEQRKERTLLDDFPHVVCPKNEHLHLVRHFHFFCLFVLRLLVLFLPISNRFPARQELLPLLPFLLIHHFISFFLLSNFFFFLFSFSFLTQREEEDSHTVVADWQSTSVDECALNLVLALAALQTTPVPLFATGCDAVLEQWLLASMARFRKDLLIVLLAIHLSIPHFESSNKGFMTLSTDKAALVVFFVKGNNPRTLNQLATSSTVERKISSSLNWLLSRSSSSSHLGFVNDRSA